MTAQNINIEELLKELSPEMLQALEQLFAEDAPAVRKTIKNILDEPISEKVEKKPLIPKTYQPTAPPRRRGRKTQEILKKFDPIPREKIRNVTNYQNEILDLYDIVEYEGEEERGRRFIRWRFIRDLEKDRTTVFMKKIREKVNTSFYARHVFSNQLRNIEDGTVIVYYINKGSPWFNNFSDAEKWLSEREKVRLDSDNIERPNTKWVFEGYFNVDVKVILDRQPLLGTGPLPDWLRNLSHSRNMIALDTYKDNLCLWRCIAVHRGSRPDRSTTAARELAKGFFNLKAAPQDCRKTSLNELDEVEKHLNKKQIFKDWLGIRVYEPERLKNCEVVWHLSRTPPAKLTNILTIGIYEGHAFFIKDITKIAKVYECVHCHARSTKACHLQRHIKKCAEGKTVIVCPAKKVELPQTVFEQTFYPKNSSSPESLRWLEKEAALRKIHIHHAACGHGGERWVESAPVDGYNHETKTVFQYHGCYWHGCRKCFPYDRNRLINKNQTREDRIKATVERTQKLLAAGYRVIEVWSCEVGKINIKLPKPQTQSYPHFILFDFEARGDKNQRKEPTNMLTIENIHVPMSVSIGDTLDREPTHICERDPAVLVRKFMEELKRREENIREQVRAAFKPEDINMLIKEQRLKIEKWCNQVPVLGFNSGKYDLNLIRKHFEELVADTADRVKVAKNGNKIMFILTKNSRFLDIINYLGPGTSYEKWVKAYECETVKSWFPYEWFDSSEKLDYKGLPDYEHWYSKLKGCYLLTKAEWEGCKKLFEEKGMKTFEDWLRYYNNLDVAPGLEELEKMRAFYTDKGIDILKDAVSISGVSLHYLLRGCVERGADLYSPYKEAYEMLKAAVVGGPSLVFTREHEVGVTKIRSHRIAEPRLCRNIVGYDANALYLSTMLRDMPCGKGRVVHYNNEATASILTQRLKEEKWFGFAEVDIEIPKHLYPKFEEMCPFFINKEVPVEAVPQHMLDYLKRTKRNRGDGKKLVGALSAKKILLYAPLLRWYLEHGALITNVYRTIDYQPTKYLLGLWNK